MPSSSNSSRKKPKELYQMIENSISIISSVAATSQKNRFHIAKVDPISTYQEIQTLVDRLSSYHLSILDANLTGNIHVRLNHFAESMFNFGEWLSKPLKTFTNSIKVKEKMLYKIQELNEGCEKLILSIKSEDKKSIDNKSMNESILMSIDGLSQSLSNALMPLNKKQSNPYSNNNNDIENIRMSEQELIGKNEPPFHAYNFTKTVMIPDDAPPLTLQDTYYRGIKFLHGLGGISCDLKQGIKLLTSSAQSGHYESMYELYRYYSNLAGNIMNQPIGSEGNHVVSGRKPLILNDDHVHKDGSIKIGNTTSKSLASGPVDLFSRGNATTQKYKELAFHWLERLANDETNSGHITVLTAKVVKADKLLRGVMAASPAFVTKIVDRSRSAVTTHKHKISLPEGARRGLRDHDLAYNEALLTVYSAAEEGHTDAVIMLGIMKYYNNEAVLAAKLFADSISSGSTVGMVYLGLIMMELDITLGDNYTYPLLLPNFNSNIRSVSGSGSDGNDGSERIKSTSSSKNHENKSQVTGARTGGFNNIHPEARAVMGISLASTTIDIKSTTTTSINSVGGITKIGDPMKGFKLIREAASRNDPKACYIVGYLIETGKVMKYDPSLEKSIVHAESFYRTGIMNNHTLCAYALGKLLVAKAKTLRDHTNVNLDKSVKKSVSVSGRSLFRTNQTNTTSSVMESTLSEALNLLRQACNDGNIHAMHTLAMLYSEGIERPHIHTPVVANYILAPDHTSALSLFVCAAYRGHQLCALLAGHTCYQLDGGLHARSSGQIKAAFMYALAAGLHEASSLQGLSYGTSDEIDDYSIDKNSNIKGNTRHNNDGTDSERKSRSKSPKSNSSASRHGSRSPSRERDSSSSTGSKGRGRSKSPHSSGSGRNLSPSSRSHSSSHSLSPSRKSSNSHGSSVSEISAVSTKHDQQGQKSNRTVKTSVGIIAEACNALALLLESGQGTLSGRPEYERAASLYYRAFVNGADQAFVNLANIVASRKLSSEGFYTLYGDYLDSSTDNASKHHRVRDYQGILGVKISKSECIDFIKGVCTGRSHTSANNNIQVGSLTAAKVNKILYEMETGSIGGSAGSFEHRSAIDSESLTLDDATIEMEKKKTREANDYIQSDTNGFAPLLNNINNPDMQVDPVAAVDRNDGADDGNQEEKAGISLNDAGADAEAEREHSDDGGKEALSVIVDEDDDHLQSPLDNPTSPTSPKSAANSVVTAVSQLSSKSAHSSSLSPVKKGLGLSSQSQHHSNKHGHSSSSSRHGHSSSSSRHGHSSSSSRHGHSSSSSRHGHSSSSSSRHGHSSSSSSRHGHSSSGSREGQSSKSRHVSSSSNGHSSSKHHSSSGRSGTGGSRNSSRSP